MTYFIYLKGLITTIKQLWFVRNIRRLIDGLCLTIALFMLFYSSLCAYVLKDNGSLLIIPIISLAVYGIIFWRIKSKTSINSHFSKLQTPKMQIIRHDLLSGTNLMLMLIFTFIQLDKLNTAKGLSGFGLVPVYLCIIGGVLFYITIIRRIIKE